MQECDIKASVLESLYINASKVSPIIKQHTQRHSSKKYLAKQRLAKYARCTRLTHLILN